MADADTIELWPENLESLSVFLRLQTQWRIGPRGPTGLDYAGVVAALALAQINSTTALFADLQAMESAALQAMKGG